MSGIDNHEFHKKLRYRGIEKDEIPDFMTIKPEEPEFEFS